MIYLCGRCGAVLEERKTDRTCDYCGAVESADLVCPHGHYSCEACRLADFPTLMERSLPRLGNDPYKEAMLIMSHPATGMFGTNHHSIPALLILSAMRRWGGVELPDARILSIARRAGEIPPGSCYMRGDCGACISAGMAASTICNVDIMSIERSYVLSTVAAGLHRLAEAGGVRCCKEAVFASLDAFFDVMGKPFPIAASFVRSDPLVCVFSKKNPECKGQSCPYYPK